MHQTKSKLPSLVSGRNLLHKQNCLCAVPSDLHILLFIIEGGDPPSMLNILGLVRKPSTDESSLDRAPSDSEGPPDCKAEQPQLTASSEPPDQENREIHSPGTSE